MPQATTLTGLGHLDENRHGSEVMDTESSRAQLSWAIG